MGEKVLRYKTENIDLSLQTNSLRAEQALKWQRSTALAFLFGYNIVIIWTFYS